MTDLKGTPRIVTPTDEEAEYRRLIETMGIRSRDIRNELISFFMTGKRDPSEQNMRLHLARACEALDMAFNDFSHIYNSFRNPAKGREFTATIKEPDERRRKTAFDGLKNAVQIGIENYNESHPDAKVRIDRLSRSGDKIAFGYSIQEPRKVATR